MKINYFIHDKYSVKEIELLRSNIDLERYTVLDTFTMPITVRKMSITSNEGVFVDSLTAQDFAYSYYMKALLPNGTVISSNIAYARIPKLALTIDSLIDPEIFIDKLNYYVEIKSGGKSRKKYPMVLGGDPRKRKLHRDQLTTPEGLYTVNKVRHKSDYYKALDLDYPHDLDKIRYELARELKIIPKFEGKTASIGGMVQIHGEGIAFNWTHGCIAMRNKDINELINLKGIREGMRIVIVGTEITRKDIEVIIHKATAENVSRLQKLLKQKGLYKGNINGVLSKNTRIALGKFQHKRNLPMTCDFDSRMLQVVETSQ